MTHRKALAYFALALTALVGTGGAARAAKCPNVAIVLDKSGSMADAPDGKTVTASNPSKWDVAKAAITKLVNTHDGRFPIGMVYFPDRTKTMNIGCSVRTALDVPIEYGTKTKILDMMGNTTVGGSTPTGAAIDGARMDAAFKDTSRQSYLLLITDGQPCCTTNCTDFSQRRTEAVNAVKNAFNATPSVKTFVVGFGQLDENFRLALNDMADAGGVPAATSGNIHFYQADSSASLDAALDRIIKTVTGGDAGGSITCDDTCYGSGCPAGQVCSSAMCKADPCQGVSCAAGQYCYSDGTTGTCVSACTQSCTAGQRCVRGECVDSACALACASGTTCDAASGLCVADSRCAGVNCRPTQGCVEGKCVDDPCANTLCPEGTGCVALEGTCMAFELDEPNTSVKTGCSCDLGRSGSHSSLPAAAAAIGMLAALLLRRRLGQAGQAS